MSRSHGQPAYHGIKDVFRSVYKEGGIRGLYRGVGMYPMGFFHLYLRYNYKFVSSCLILHIDWLRDQEFNVFLF